MRFGKRRKQKTSITSGAMREAADTAMVQQQLEPPAPSNEKVWIELARLEQEVAELAQIVATKHQEAARLWESVNDEEVKRNAREIALNAWTLEKKLLYLAEMALSRAEGELQRA